MLFKSRRLLAMPVVSLSDGQAVGRVRSLVVDPGSLAVVALALEAGGLFREQKVVPFAAIKSIGEHAVTVEDAGAVARLSAVPDLAPLVQRPSVLLGARIITEDGRFLGHAEEYLFDERGTIDHFVVGGGTWQTLLRGKGRLPARAIRTVGRGSLIVRAESVQELVWEGGHIRNLRESWRRFLGSGKGEDVPPPPAQG